jgi:hypothetical protein
MERSARDKDSGILHRFVNYKHKKVYNIALSTSRKLKQSNFLEIRLQADIHKKEKE